MSDWYWQILRRLPTDYKESGGEVDRWADPETHYPDCSHCTYFRRLAETNELAWNSDWGVCTNTLSPRAGLLTWEHQAGVGCHREG